MAEEEHDEKIERRNFVGDCVSPAGFFFPFVEKAGMMLMASCPAKKRRIYVNVKT
ncbi:MAG: hypothetical protein KHZ72_10910 [Lachnospiraceae bacterium]|nr:hypothetical protein [Lachnospiraceae bacterium]